MLLKDLSVNEEGIITALNVENTLKRRLKELGFIQGAKVKKISREIFKLNNDCVFTLKKKEQMGIKVDLVPNTEKEYE